MEAAAEPSGNFSVKLISDDGSEEVLHDKNVSGNFPNADFIVEKLN